MISGAIFATQTNTGLLYNASWTALSFAFGALTFVSSYANYSSVVVALATAEIFALAQFVTALPASTHLLTAGFAIPFAAIIIHLTWITVDFTRRSVYDVMKRREEVEEDQGFELTAYPTRRTLTQRVYSLHANPIAWAVLGFVGVLVRSKLWPQKEDHFESSFARSRPPFLWMTHANIYLHLDVSFYF